MKLLDDQSLWTPRGAASLAVAPAEKKPPLGQPISAQPWRLSITSVREMLSKMRPPSRLNEPTAEAMMVDSTIAYTTRAIFAILQSLDNELECSEDEDVAAYGQQAADDVIPMLLPHVLLSFIYGENAVQKVYGLEDREIVTAKPSGKRRTRFPDTYFPQQFRSLEPGWRPIEGPAKDYAGIEVEGQKYGPESVALFVHQQRRGRFFGISGLLPQWRPWMLEFRLFDDFGLYQGGKASPPLKCRAPDPREWKQFAQGDVAQTGITDPISWTLGVGANVYSNGGFVLPSAKRLGPTGSDLGYLFDIEQLQLAARGEEYERMLLFLRLLKIEGAFGSSVEGMAAAKQAARSFFSMLYTDALEIAQQIHDQVIRPVIVLAFQGRGRAKVPRTRLVPGQPAENRRELLVDLLKTFRDSRLRLDDGREVPIGNLIAANRAFRQLSTPLVDEDQVADGPAAPAAAPAGMPPGRPQKDPGAKPFASDEPEERREKERTGG